MPATSRPAEVSQNLRAGRFASFAANFSTSRTASTSSVVLPTPGGPTSSTLAFSPCSLHRVPLLPARVPGAGIALANGPIAHRFGHGAKFSGAAAAASLFGVAGTRMATSINSTSAGGKIA